MAEENLPWMLLTLRFLSWFSMGIYVLVSIFTYMFKFGTIKYHLLAGCAIFGLAVLEFMANEMAKRPNEMSAPYRVLVLLFLMLLVTIGGGHFGWATFVAVLMFIPWVCVSVIVAKEFSQSTPLYETLMED